MQKYQIEFIELALANKVLSFGDFTLKSGRKSPYFFNSGLFNTGGALAQLGHYYACAIQASGLDYNMLFGPAYKGIPLASAVAIALKQHFNRDLPLSFNRKEAKDHGEGGIVFGAKPQGKVLIIDDVITAGTSANIAIDIIKQAGAAPVGVAIAMDRQERGQNSLSVVQELEQRHGIRVISIVTLNNIIDYMNKVPDLAENLEKIRQYRKQYGV